MGLIIFVYKDGSGDCTNGGISSRHSRLCVTNVEGPFEPTDDCPAVILENHVRGVLRLVPPDHKKVWYQMGGNYGATSDSRFTEACERLTGHEFYGAVAIHDRCE